MENEDVRLQVFTTEVTYRAIAAKMGVSHEYVCRLMSHPLSEKNRERILQAIEALKDEKSNGEVIEV